MTITQPAIRIQTKKTSAEDVLDYRRQQAIPWCTAHDSRENETSGRCEMSMWLIQDGGIHCLISSGGLDHKWWVDA